MENQISAAALAFIDMTIVFAILFFLAGVIQLIKAVAYKGAGTPAEKKTEASPAVNPDAKEAAGTGAVEPAGGGDVPVKVAAACAAVAAYLEGTSYRIQYQEADSAKPLGPGGSYGKYYIR